MKRIDRRALFSSGAAAALLAASGVSLDAAPRAGGELRIAVPRDGETLERLVRGAAFDCLTEIAPDGALHGELATGWAGSEDARLWQFDLRTDVTFHNGQSLQAQDVVASLLAHDGLARLRAMSIRATGPATVQFQLLEPNPHLPFRLSDQSFAIFAGGAVELPPEESVGTGCYETMRFQPDRQYLGKKAEDHYKAGQAGWFQSVQAVVIPDSAVRAEALRDRVVDVAVLPAAIGLREQEGLVLLPSADNITLATHIGVGIPMIIAGESSLDGGRLAERWWRV